jgi:A/G-specific adenine glycosylase
MMEFGALQCVPKSPDCTICVFNAKCVALQTGRVGELPVKLKKTKVTNRYFNYLIIKDGEGKSVIKKRTAKGIWHNLYEFPLIETEAAFDKQAIVGLIKGYDEYDLAAAEIRLLNEDAVVHKLSHQHLYVKFWEVKTLKRINDSMDYQVFKEFPFPVVIHNFMEKHWE